MVRSHIQPDRSRGAWPPRTVAAPPAGVRRRVPYLSAAALTQRLPAWSQNRWLLVVLMTDVWPRALTRRSYRFVSWWSRTAVMVPAWSLPVRVLAVRTFWPRRSREIGVFLPLASRTLVPGLKLSPPQVTAAPARSASAKPTPISTTLPTAAAQLANVGWVTQLAMLCRTGPRTMPRALGRSDAGHEPLVVTAGDI